MNKLFFILLISFNVFATQQIRNRIHYNHQTSIIIKGPSLDHYIKLKNFPKPQRKTTACHRGYVAYWKISEGGLYLKKVKMKAKNASEFNFREFKGRKATWYTGDIIVLAKNTGKDRPENVKVKSIYLKIKDGDVVDEYETCLCNFSNDYYRIGKAYYDNNNYLFAAAQFYKLITEYPDFFKNDCAGLYLISSLKWMGLSQFADELYDRLNIEYPKSYVVNLHKNNVVTIKGEGDKVLALKDPKYENYLRDLLPWLFEIQADNEKIDKIRTIIEEKQLFEKSCLDTKFDFESPRFENEDLNALYGQYLKAKF